MNSFLKNLQKILEKMTCLDIDDGILKVLKWKEKKWFLEQIWMSRTVLKNHQSLEEKKQNLP